MTDRERLKTLRVPSVENPLRILMSSCLTGITCGYDGTANGKYPSALALLKYKTVKPVTFCPEEFSFGSPREMCDIHGGTGIDILNGKAKFLSESGIDWTEGILNASQRMLEIAKNNHVELCVMMDISGACGSQVVYNGNRFGKNPSYLKGMGVAAALLHQNGFQIISQRDFASLEILYSKINPSHKINMEALDHHEIEWFQDYFSDPQD